MEVFVRSTLRCTPCQSEMVLFEFCLGFLNIQYVSMIRGTRLSTRESMINLLGIDNLSVL